MDATNGDAPHLAPAEDDAGRQPLGEIFVELGFVAREQLDAALVVQRRTGARIGEILVEQGSLSRLDLASALAEHWEPRSYPSDDDVSPSLTMALRAPAGARQRAGEPATPDLEALPEPALDGPAQELPARPWWGLRRAHSGAATGSSQADVLAARLAALEEVEGAIAELRVSIVELGRSRVVDAVATGTRLAGAEDAVTGLEEDIGTLTQLVTELRTDLAELAQRPATEEPSEALLELSVRVDRVARDGHDRAAGLAEELRDEARARSTAVGARLDHQTDELAAFRVEMASLAGRLDELLALRQAEADAAQAAGPAAELEALGEELAALGRRLDEQAAMGEEQARAIEIALLEGLNGLGKRLTRSAKKHGKPGKGLRRPIERLGAAIIEAETLADRRSLVTEAAGCVAFAPSESGYRLVELPWRPDVGATIEVDDSGPLAVTRYGRSPLPFDRRPCAFLERIRA